MSRSGRTRCATLLALAITAGLGSAAARAQNTPRPPILSTPAPVTPAPTRVPEAPGSVIVGPGEVVAEAPGLPTEVQVVRFQGPDGVRVEVLGPNPEPVPVGDGKGLITVGLKVGTSYRLRVSNLPNRPSAEFFPVIEMVGHLHRPAAIDPGKYPVRVVFTEEDFDDVVARGRLVTQVIYLEDPEQALPIAMPKDQIPMVTLSPSEDPLKVGAALGRVMAIVRMGARKPTPEETAAGMGWAYEGPWGVCPFTQNNGGKCMVACGPVCGTPPPPGKAWMPKDEYLCDGGDAGDPVRFSGDGGLAGLDPRDAVIKFDDGRRARALPTNVVCVYAPRFAEVRSSVGPNENLIVEASVGMKTLAKQATEAVKEGPKRLTMNQGAEASRNRERASGLANRQRAGVHEDSLAAAGNDAITHIAVNIKGQNTEKMRIREKASFMLERQKNVGIKTAESAVVTGITEGASQAVMTWAPSETVGVETPPGRPGMAVIKRVSAGEAEPGDTLTYVIQFRNMGNTAIRDVTIVDSLLPRLGYIKGSAQGPKGTAFTADDNRVGGTELKWVLPSALKPGAEGRVTFQALVR